MKVRVGVDESIDESVLEGFPADVHLVRIPEDPVEDIPIDFWIAAMPPRILRRQWPHLKGVKVIQVPWAGVDTLLGLFPREITLCDARGVHDIPTAEWAVAAIFAMQKCLPFFIGLQSKGVWAFGQQAQQIDHTLPTKIKNPPAPIRDVPDTTVLIVGYGSIGQAIEIIDCLDTDRLTRTYEIQNYRVSGVEVVYHVVEHFAEHTGQIIFATKSFTGEDMGFYWHLRNTGQSEQVP